MRCLLALLLVACGGSTNAASSNPRLEEAAVEGPESAAVRELRATIASLDTTLMTTPIVVFEPGSRDSGTVSHVFGGAHVAPAAWPEVTPTTFLMAPPQPALDAPDMRRVHVVTVDLRETLPSFGVLSLFRDPRTRGSPETGLSHQLTLQTSAEPAAERVAGPRRASEPALDVELHRLDVPVALFGLEGDPDAIEWLAPGYEGLDSDPQIRAALAELEEKARTGEISAADLARLAHASELLFNAAGYAGQFPIIHLHEAPFRFRIRAVLTGFEGVDIEVYEGGIYVQLTPDG